MVALIDVEPFSLITFQKMEVKKASPKLVQEDLYFGRNIGAEGEVSEADFQAFIDAEVTPAVINE